MSGATRCSETPLALISASTAPPPLAWRTGREICAAPCAKPRERRGSHRSPRVRRRGGGKPAPPRRRRSRAARAGRLLRRRRAVAGRAPVGRGRDRTGVFRIFSWWFPIPSSSPAPVVSRGDGFGKKPPRALGGDRVFWELTRLGEQLHKAPHDGARRTGPFRFRHVRNPVKAGMGECPERQRGRTVNPLAKPSKVRVLPLPPFEN